VIRLYTEKTWFDVEDMSYQTAALIHAGDQDAFDVSAKEFGDSQFRRMSIAADQVVRVEELP
jgi:hypothetical protein